MSESVAVTGSTVRPTQRRASHCPWDDPDPRSSTLRWLPLALAVCLSPSPSGQSPHWLRWCHPRLSSRLARPPDSPQLWLTILRPASETGFMNFTLTSYSILLRNSRERCRHRSTCSLLCDVPLLVIQYIIGFFSSFFPRLNWDIVLVCDCVCDARLHVRVIDKKYGWVKLCR